MPVGKEAGLGPGHIVLDGDPVGTHQRMHSSPSPLFGPCLLWQTVAHLSNCWALVYYYMNVLRLWFC